MAKSKMIIIFCVVTITNSIALALPAHFDWRDVGGNNWMTPVRDQEQCNSCWAFAAVGAVEAKLNIWLDYPDYDVDLSEQYLVSTCGGGGDCGGGWHYLALNFIKSNGITDEACFPYIGSNSPCNRCSDWQDRLWKIDDTVKVNNAVGYIKVAIYFSGPLAVSFHWGNGDWYDGIYKCYNPRWHTHAVVLVGWDDTDEYWIAKNSWDETWGPDGNGYFKIGYGECLVQEKAYKVSMSNPTDKFYVKNSSNENIAWFDNLGNIVLKGTLTTGGDCADAPEDSFLVQRCNGKDCNTVAYIDSSTGDMCIEGDFSDNQPYCMGGGFIIKDSSGAIVSSISSYYGHLCLTGKLYENAIP